jgi:GH24 family phage-related lysozyme (muramidase)
MAHRLSSDGYQELIRMEANRLAVYDDFTGQPINSYEEAGGTPTIGIGLAIQSASDREKFRPYLGGRKATPEFMETENRRRLLEFENAVNGLLGSAKVTQAMFDALFFLAWNAGPGAKSLKDATSAILRGDYAAAQQAIANGPTYSKGRYMPALAERRAKEAVLFMSQGLPGGAGTALVLTATLAAAALAGTLFWVYREPLRARFKQLRG